MKNMKSEGYKHIWTVGDGEHILQDTRNGQYEIWFSNKNHASYGLVYKNTHLEFARTVTAEDARQFAIDWQTWQSERSMYMSELAEWQNHFETLAKKHNLTDEFKENGII